MNDPSINGEGRSAIFFAFRIHSEICEDISAFVENALLKKRQFGTQSNFTGYGIARTHYSLIITAESILSIPSAKQVHH
jgi:hypothetical protein